jgi:hypothetical protein
MARVKEQVASSKLPIEEEVTKRQVVRWCAVCLHATATKAGRGRGSSGEEVEVWWWWWWWIFAD